MPYATQADLASRFGTAELIQLTDRTNANAIDAAVVATALADADGIIAPYLAARYALPVSPVPVALSRIASDIARYLLWKDNPPEFVRDNYEDALGMLKALMEGKAVLPGAAAAPDGATPAAGAGRVGIDVGGGRQLTRPSLAEFLG